MANVDVCGTTASPPCLSIVFIAAKGPKSASELRKELKVAQPIAGHPLALLRARKIVARRRDGKQQIYSLLTKRLSLLKKFIAELP